MKKVNDWFTLGESKKLEDQVMYNIAMACEGLLNSYYDGNNDTEMTKQDWVEYLYNTLQKYLEVEWGTVMDEYAAMHLRFYGKKRTLELIDYFLDNYEDVQEYIAQ